MANWTGAGTGAISGASAGGSAFGPLGAAAGGLLGGVAGLFGKKKRKPKRISSLDKNQQKLNESQHQSIFGQGPLADLYNYNPEEANAVFDKNIANPAYRSFKENTIPSITGQFRNQGLQTSSYVGDSLSKAGRDVQEGLDAKRAQYLYGEQNNARNAKRNAVENLQNRSTFAYDTANRGSNGFDINQILSSISPDMIDQFRNYFSRGK